MDTLELTVLGRRAGRKADLRGVDGERGIFSPGYVLPPDGFSPLRSLSARGNQGERGRQCAYSVGSQVPNTFKFLSRLAHSGPVPRPDASF